MNTNPNTTLGRITIKVDGAEVKSWPGAEIDKGGVVRTDKENSHHPGQFSEKQKGGSIKAKFSITADTSLEDFDAMNDVTIVSALDTGQTYVGAHYYCVEVPPFTDEDGTVEIEFKGPKMEKM